MKNSGGSIEYLLKRDRIIIISGLLLIFLLAWLYIIYLYRQMFPMNMDALFFAMPMTSAWTATDFILLFLMWFIMMIAMMMPSVAPLILIFAMVNRKRKDQQNPFVSTGYLVAGYFFIWAAFSLLATFLQWLLQHVSLLAPEMRITSNILGGSILILAGLFQFTPLKKTCLSYCRTPVDFIHRNWKEGKAGAIRMGIENGIYCVGCCWILMALLFVSGIMNLVWVALIALFVLMERVLGQTRVVSPLAGAALIMYGMIIMLW
jgi:predicted metal-binding membrane protein